MLSRLRKVLCKSEDSGLLTPEEEEQVKQTLLVMEQSLNEVIDNLRT